ncbi:hypothetical protein APR04_000464 [Promicromonospora umidemergens]|uniref:Uncharacterized protein n=1 Tax=Promicromonospora umidemergens TaxID=629679 RepID=A0ABP8X8N4_9MICO|nr:hypothetical protein [Promicromonospora umidemergens]MCP2281575.1 hypothetical protein [Promicromonospora umidemergens]
MSSSIDSMLRSATGVTPGAHRLAHVLALITLPSGLWRIALVAGLPVVNTTIVLPFSERVQIVGLSVFAELLALLSLGLVQRWGEVVPGWLPLVGGRPIHRIAATVPAALGAAALTGIWTFAVVNVLRGTTSGALDFYFPTVVQKVVLLVCYVPLLAWGPLLAVLTVAYFRRRTA